jgi:hypothetical protein
MWLPRQGFSTTLGLALLGQDVVIFISSNMAAVVRAGRFSIWLLVVNFNFSFFNWALVPGGRFSNPPTTPSPAR